MIQWMIIVGSLGVHVWLLPGFRVTVIRWPQREDIAEVATS